ncbi:MAG: hypothetical protein IPG50_28180 [Myxococcales bacterium]|nr:hypothetical protein [Myxococcales bacterium]
MTEGFSGKAKLVNRRAAGYRSNHVVWARDFVQAYDVRFQEIATKIRRRLQRRRRPGRADGTARAQHERRRTVRRLDPAA